MPSTLFDLTGTTVLVTGANSGIGYGMADALAAAGANLVIWGRRAERNAEAAQAFERHGVQVLAQQVDTGDEAQVDTAFAEVVARTGPIGAVFANAGRSGSRTPFHQIDTAAYRALIESNQMGTFFTLRAATAHMIEVASAGGVPGSLVITGSSSMLWGTRGNADYAMTKGALEALTRTLAVELGPLGIRVNCLLPGMIESEFGQKTATNDWIRTNAAMRRAGRADEMGGIAVYLASRASSYHTADSIVIDGGLTAQQGAA
jgi:NAD(P)-dependent dehydrogenase (short-subunit alcohol dehydrogenase family)